MAASNVLRFGPRLKELRIHLCQNSPASQGVRDFIKNNFVSIKKVNPSTPILVRECSGIPPKIWARYEFGEEASVLVSDKTSDQVLKHIEELSLK